MNEDIFPPWKQEYIRGLEESLAFFRRDSKSEREKWVARRLISALGIAFQESEIKRGREEPADVLFRNAHFQVKEMLDEGRKRTKEFIEKLERARSAKSFSDLLEHYEPQDITFAEIVQRCASYATDILNHYGPHERKNIDLICYFNYVDYHETNTMKIENGNTSFRSFSVVSNRFCAVINTAADAPQFLSKNNGRIIKVY
jgi:hypothetical protein